MDELPPLPAIGNMPLPSFFEVQWSSVRVCDPLLTYKQPTSPKDHFNDDLLKIDAPTKNLALLSPTPPSSLDASSMTSSIHPDLLLEGQGCIPQSSGTRNNIFSEDTVHTTNEISSEMWQM